MSGKSSAKRAAKNQRRLIEAQAVRDRAKLAEEKDVMKRKEAIASRRSAGRASLLATSPSGQTPGVAKAANLGGA
jgi:hypothetical protein